MTHKKHTNGHQTPTFGSEFSVFHTDIIYTLLTFPFYFRWDIMTTRELSCLSKLSVRTLLIVTTANSGLIPFIWLCADAGFGSVSSHRAWIVQHTSCCKNPVNIVRVCSRLCVWPKERVWDGDCPVLIHPCMQSDILLENESERKKTQLNNNCFPFTKLTIVKHSMLLWTLDIMKQVGGEDLTFFFGHPM